jgi:hypothetical protein
MNKTRIVGRIIAGALASALLVAGALGTPAQAKSDNTTAGGQTQQAKDTGWGTI